jgi:bifunctional non-homologous end joining protein LigD
MTVTRDMTLPESTLRTQGHMRSHRSRRPRFIAPCLPSAAERPPAEPGWIHEIKHRGHRLMARRNGAGVRLRTGGGIDWTRRYPAIAVAVGALRCRSCLIDGQAVACDEDRVAVSRRRRPPDNVVLFAFDLLELDGQDLRREPIETRKYLLGKLLKHAKPSLQLSEDMADAGDVVFRYACDLGLAGIVSKRLGSFYRSGRSRDWIITKSSGSRR